VRRPAPGLASGAGCDDEARKSNNATGGDRRPPPRCVRCLAV